MKRALLLLLALLTALPLVAEDRAAKKKLIAELLEVLDAKALTQASFDTFLANVQETPAASMVESLPPEQRAEYEAERKKADEQMRSFRERLYARIDYAKLADEVYAPLFDEHFNVAELEQLLVFFKTKPGQKLAKILPDLGLGSAMKGMNLVNEAAAAAQEEMAKEEAAKDPWKKTMSDLRSLATALEARATDTNEYPNVSSFEDLEPLISPTYIRTVPKVDAWGTPFLYVANGEHYRFVSAGADKRFEWNARQLDPNAQPKPSESLDTDIIYQDGTFVQYPKQANVN